jgi:hypothetical protein
MAIATPSHPHTLTPSHPHTLTPTDTSAHSLACRAALDVELLVAEQEHIAGLPPPPHPLPMPGLPPPPAGVTLRRLEATCQSHQALRRHLQAQLALLEGPADSPAAAELLANGVGGDGGFGTPRGDHQGAASEEESEGEEEQRGGGAGAGRTREQLVSELQRRLQALGPAPARLALTGGEELRLRREAEERVARGDCGVQVCGGGAALLRAPLLWQVVVAARERVCWQQRGDCWAECAAWWLPLVPGGGPGLDPGWGTAKQRLLHFHL